MNLWICAQKQKLGSELNQLSSYVTGAVPPDWAQANIVPEILFFFLYLCCIPDDVAWHAPSHRCVTACTKWSNSVAHTSLCLPEEVWFVKVKIVGTDLMQKDYNNLIPKELHIRLD